MAVTDDALGGELSMFVPPIQTSRDPREMLHLIETAEHEDVVTYARRAAEAEAFGDIGLKVQLETIVLDETRHLEEIRKIQASWS
jgi:bacterioferritin